MRRIRITEAQYKILTEGVDWSKNQNGAVNLSINQDKTDRGNRSGKNWVDTRVFGNKNDVLYSDETGRKSFGLQYKSIAKPSAIEYYKNVINFVKNGRQGTLEVPKDTPKRTITTVNGWFSNGSSDSWIIDAATKAIARTELEANPYLTYSHD